MTLAVSQKLAALIDREPGMRAVLTRRGDYFVDLNKRSEIARKAKADLLVSVRRQLPQLDPARCLRLGTVDQPR